MRTFKVIYQTTEFKFKIAHTLATSFEDIVRFNPRYNIIYDITNYEVF